MKHLKYLVLSVILSLPLATSCAATNKYDTDHKHDTDQSEKIFNYTATFNADGEIIVRDAKGNIIEGVRDNKPIKRINNVKTFTIIEGEGSHFIMYNGFKHYLPGPHPSN